MTSDWAAHTLPAADDEVVPIDPGPRSATEHWRILLVEDEAIFARAVATSLQRAGHACTIAGTLTQARAFLASKTEDPPDLVILDSRLPDGDGIELLAPLVAQGESAPMVVVITAYGDVSQAVRAMKAGAADYLKKPVDLDELLVTVNKAMRASKLRSRLSYSQTRESHSGDLVDLIGDSAKLRELRSAIATIARIGGSRPPHVLILGETGTGKDVTARLLHRLGPRANRPFVHVDCTSLPKEIMEAELFGHTRGAFTSAHTARAGLIEAAENGTVFLDEIGELPAELQSKLLNVLERRRLRRVGSSREVEVEARFIAATNRDLPWMVQRGDFRSDLYYRLNALTISLPPLRERSADIPALARHFVDGVARAYGKPLPPLRDDALAALCEYTWPGNVRELKNVLERATLFAGEGGLTAESFDFSVSLAPERVRPGAAGSEPQTLAGAERDLIEAALIAVNGNIARAARQLGITRMALRYRAEKHGLNAGDYRKKMG